VPRRSCLTDCYSVKRINSFIQGGDSRPTCKSTETFVYHCCEAVERVQTTFAQLRWGAPYVTLATDDRSGVWNWRQLVDGRPYSDMIMMSEHLSSSWPSAGQSVSNHRAFRYHCSSISDELYSAGRDVRCTVAAYERWGTPRTLQNEIHNLGNFFHRRLCTYCELVFQFVDSFSPFRVVQLHR